MAAKATVSLFDPKDLSPSLREVIEAQHLNGAKLTVAIPTDENQKIQLSDRHTILLHDGEHAAHWQVMSLRELFRGDKKPPADMSHYPEEYVPVFYFIEKHALTIDVAVKGLRDKDFEEIYSMLRRRPDGKSIGAAHDILWQVGVTALGLRSLSQAEFEEVFGQLARSCRHFQIGPTSRNYIEYLQSSFT